jgi:hypothetical protein
MPLGGLPLRALRREILLFLYILMFPWRKKIEKLFTYVEVPKLWVPLRFGNIPMGGLPSRQRRSSYFYMLSCSHQGKKKRSCFMYVESFLYSWVFLRFRNTIKWCSLNITHSYNNLPYNINLLWPKLNGGNIIGSRGNPNQQSEIFDKFHQNHVRPWNHMMLLDNWIAKL